MMKDKLNITLADKKNIIERFKTCLKNRRDIVFAYLHGSFVMGDGFKDIDVAVYLSPLPSSPLQTELQMETELGNVIQKFSVDVRILNNAPLSFRYNVIKNGQPVVVNNDDLRSDFVETTLSNYFDFAPFLKTYLKEALGSGI